MCELFKNILYDLLAIHDTGSVYDYLLIKVKAI